MRTVRVVFFVLLVSAAASAAVTLKKITVTPLQPTRPLGVQLQFLATGTYSDNSTQDMTTIVTWVSSNTTVATVSNTPPMNGLVSTYKTGSVTITARYGSVNGSTAFKITAAQMSSIVVTPTDAQIARRASLQYSATAVYTNGTTKPLTTATWTSSNPAAATIATTGLAVAGSAPGTTSITATTGSISGTTGLTVLNGVPEANSQAVTTDEKTSAAITLTASDPEGDALTYAVMSGPSRGTLSGAAPNLIYTPDVSLRTLGPGQSATDAFTFRVQDTYGATSGTATINITINCINEPPTTGGASFSTDEDTPTTATLVANDPDGDAVIFELVSVPSKGTVSNSGLTVTYTPDLSLNSLAVGQSATDSFTYKVRDPYGAESSVATVNISIAGKNDPPVLQPLTITLQANTTVTFTVTATDPDSGDTIQYGTAGQAQHGSCEQIGQNVTYTPAAGYSGSDACTVTFADQNGASVTDVINLIVNAATPKVVSLSLSPVNPMIPLTGAVTRQMHVTASYDDNSQGDVTARVTWSVSDPTVAAVDPGGVLSAGSAGQVTVTATLDDVSGSTTLTANGDPVLYLLRAGDSYCHPALDVVNAHTMTRIRTQELPLGDVRSLAVSPDHQRYYVVNETFPGNGELEVVDQDGTVNTDLWWVNAREVLLSSDGSTLYVGARDGICILNTAESFADPWACQWPAISSGVDLYGMALSPDGRWLAAADQGVTRPGGVWIVDTVDLTSRLIQIPYGGYLYSGPTDVVFSSNQQVLAWDSAADIISVVDLNTNTVTGIATLNYDGRTMPAPWNTGALAFSPVRGLAYLADQTAFVTIDPSNPATWAMTAPAAPQLLKTAAMMPDGQTLIFVETDYLPVPSYAPPLFVSRDDVTTGAVQNRVYATQSTDIRKMKVVKP